MEVTATKIAANQANARMSTGPRTTEGKARSSQNACRHGLTSQRLIVREDEHDEFATLERDLRTRVKPVGALELEIFRQLLRASWNLRRIERLEDELFDGSADPLGDSELDVQMDRLARYQARHERSFYRALKELRTLQTDRMLKASYPPSVAQLITEPVSTAQLLKRSQSYEPERFRWDTLMEIEADSVAFNGENDPREVPA